MILKRLMKQRALFKGVQNVSYLSSKDDVLKDSDALVLLTEWKEFRCLILKNKITIKNASYF